MPMTGSPLVRSEIGTSMAIEWTFLPLSEFTPACVDSGMPCAASREVLDLLATGHAGGHHLGVRRGRLHRRREAAVAEGDREIVVLALESERLMLETLEGACEQARRRQEDERKSRLKHHEDGARE